MRFLYCPIIYKLIGFTLLMIESKLSFASGVGSVHHQPSPLDLLMPAINLSILIGAIIYFVRKPVQRFFKERARDVSESFERANIKSKESKMMLETEKKKIYRADDEELKIMEAAKIEALAFEKEYVEMMKIRGQKAREDASLRIENEKNEMIQDLHKELVDEVALKTKEIIRKSSFEKEKISNKLVEHVGN